MFNVSDPYLARQTWSEIRLQADDDSDDRQIPRRPGGQGAALSARRRATRLE